MINGVKKTSGFITINISIFKVEKIVDVYIIAKQIFKHYFFDWIKYDRKVQIKLEQKFKKFKSSKHFLQTINRIIKWKTFP